MARSGNGPEGTRGKRRPIRRGPLYGRLKAGPGPRPTLVLSIGRRSGGATVRSRVKRVLREAFRQAAPRLPAGARVEIGADGDLSKIPRKAIREAAEGLLRRLTDQW